MVFKKKCKTCGGVFQPASKFGKVCIVCRKKAIRLGAKKRIGCVKLMKGGLPNKKVAKRRDARILKKSNQRKKVEEANKKFKMKKQEVRIKNKEEYVKVYTKLNEDRISAYTTFNSYKHRHPLLKQLIKKREKIMWYFHYLDEEINKRQRKK